MSIRTDRGARWLVAILALVAALGAPTLALPAAADYETTAHRERRTRATAPIYRVVVPLAHRSVAPPPTLTPTPVPAPVAPVPDLNLALRSYQPTSQYWGLVDYNGEADLRAPQLPGLFSDNRTPTFRATYQVFDWSWPTNSRGAALTNWPVTLVGLGTTAGELIRVPGSGYDIGGGHQVMVLYASETRATLKYTCEDNVVIGYAIHLEHVAVDPDLLGLYRAMDASGRRSLPALRAGQAVGRANGAEIGVAIRDSGTFMDPRARKDWWAGR